MYSKRKVYFMQFNNYALYAMNAGVSTVDEVDGFLYDLQHLNQYDDVVKYLNDKFGDTGSEKVIDYPDLNKQIEIVYKDDAVEFFAAKEWKQYYGKGWRKP